ncbi:T9SS type A sorting domain-containing protein [Chryseobacterium arachidis]|uniref:T9SS type A sorting domain-containing protein n=1 Tax=Chryseobacterium arachidis TaxID=1416778 RepID=UPI00093319C7|nr:T9SS type A sorting domain-containing protein [Chryseobacterium arachidis]
MFSLVIILLKAYIFALINNHEKFIFFLLLINFTFYNSQAPSVQWNKYIGGSQQEAVNAMKITNDGGYIFAGSTQSVYIDNIFMNHQGSTTRPDYWILKTDSNGTIQWTKSFGGTNEDRAYDVQQTPDGGYILVGVSLSNDGDVTDHKGIAGSADCWVIKLDSLGNLQWKKSFGGTFSDYANTVILTADGNYVIAGSSYSNNGDVNGHHGSQSTIDSWMIKINPLGNVLWSKSLGGTSDDMFKDLKQTPDGGYILAADSWSNDGDIVNGHHGTTYFSNMWIVKTDANGDIQWQKSLGGSNDEISNSVELTPDGGFIFAGEGNSGDGDVSFHFGPTAPFPSPDYWVVKTDGFGNIQWEKSFGGTNSDMAMSAKSTSDGGYLIAGHTGSTDGQIVERFGANFNYDYWTLKLNGSGDIIWQKTLGGQHDDYITDIYSINNGYVAVGRSSSNSQNTFDLLLYQLGTESLGVDNFTAKNAISLYPNPVKDIFYFSEQLMEIELYSLDGKLIIKIPSAKSIDLPFLSHGEYLLKGITQKQKSFVKKFLKN